MYHKCCHLKQQQEQKSNNNIQKSNKNIQLFRIWEFGFIPIKSFSGIL